MRLINAPIPARAWDAKVWTARSISIADVANHKVDSRPAPLSEIDDLMWISC